MRGFGFSSYKNKVKSYKDLAHDMHLFMTETFPHITSYFIFGHNIGGNVAMELALQHAKVCKGIVLLALSA